MALVSDLIKVGLSVRQCEILGDTFASISAAGTTVSDATAATSSIIHINATSGANAGVVLPKIDASPTKHYIVANESGSNARIYVNDSATEGIKHFGTTGTAAYVNVGSGAWVELVKLATDIWGAFA